MQLELVQLLLEPLHHAHFRVQLLRGVARLDERVGVPLLAIVVDLPVRLVCVIRVRLRRVDLAVEVLRNALSVLRVRAIALDDVFDRVVGRHVHVGLVLADRHEGGQRVHHVAHALPQLVQHVHELLPRRVQQHRRRPEGHVDDEQLLALRGPQPGAEVGRGPDGHPHQGGLEHVVHEADAVPEHRVVVPRQALMPGPLLGLELLLDHGLGFVLGLDLDGVRLDAARHRRDQAVEELHGLVVLPLQVFQGALDGVHPHLVLVVAELRERVHAVLLDEQDLHLFHFVDEAVHLHERLDKQRLREETSPRQALPVAAEDLVAGVHAPLVHDLFMYVVLEEGHRSQHAVHEALAHPLVQRHALGQLPGLDVDDAVRGDREVLRVDLVLWHNHQVVWREGVRIVGDSPVAVQQLDLRAAAVAREEGDGVLAGPQLGQLLLQEVVLNHLYAPVVLLEHLL
mmetsp:Transcript_66766/g.204300  ORF Transcript_66766/g.204300 Transcript_66766/m.204300 type:complete len:455 (-) Transcript_66766:312-1676(-)